MKCIVEKRARILLKMETRFRILRLLLILPLHAMAEDILLLVLLLHARADRAVQRRSFPVDAGHLPGDEVRRRGARLFPYRLLPLLSQSNTR